MTDRAASFADLRGQVAVVTGAAGGIGGAIASTLAGAGARVVLNDRREDALGHARARLDAPGRDTMAIAADVSTREGARAVVQAAVDSFGDISILVNVVGGLKGPINRPFMEIDDEQWDFATRVNLRTTFQCMQAALAFMIPRRAGRIVNIASTSWAGSPDHADYAAAKAGVVALTRSVAEQVGQHGITVNAVAPGLTVTEALAGDDERIAVDVPLGRANEPADVAASVRFLCSDAARNISGQLLTVAGGRNPSL